MKNKLTFFIVLALLISTVIVLASCGETNEQEHVHTLLVTERVEPTCTETGLTSGVKCAECGEILSAQETIDALGHTEEIIASVAPTCTETGLTEGKKCSVCGVTTLAQETVAALGHTEETVPASQPTCTEVGFTSYIKCSICEIKITEPQTIDKIPCNFVDGFCTECEQPYTSEGLTFKISDDETYAILVDIGSCKDSIVYVPSTYHNLPVKEIGKDAFSSISQLKEVYLPSTVETICEGAFSGCTSLTSIIIPDSVTSIGSSAFYDCTSLDMVIIPNSVTSIGDYAFLGCSRLTIYCNATSEPSGWNSEWNSSSRPAVWGMKSKGITEAGLSWVQTSNDEIIIIGYTGNNTQIVIPNTINALFVTSIGENAFHNCTSLMSVTIPDSVTSIGDSAFYDCTSLTEINFNATAMNDLSSDNRAFYNVGINGDGIKVTIGKNVTKIPAHLFHPFNGHSYLSKITSIVFEEGSVCESIGECVFLGCTSITSVVIPNSVTSIGRFAFSDCTSLASITIGNSVTSIGIYAFRNCTSLTEINFNATAMNGLNREDRFDDAGKDGAGIKVTIGKNVTKIPDYLFYSSLYSPKITSVVFEEGSVCESIGSYAFHYCTSLRSITIPDSVTAIGDHTFAYCYSLTGITIGDNVKTIGYYAFSHCTSLDMVIIPDSVTSIKGYAFDNCALLRSVTIGNSVTSIGEYAFSYCYSMTSITIPDSVTSIENSAFFNCYKLVEVYDLSSLDITVGSMSNGCVGYYAKVVHTSLDEESILETVDDYIFMTWEDKYYLIAYIGNDAELILPESYNGNNYEIYQYAFNSHDDITKVTIPDSVKTMGNYAFAGCTSLDMATIGDSVTHIGGNAFEDCASLTSITIPDSVTSIGYEAFSACTSLTSVTIGNSVTIIGGYTFEDCASLTTITIPNNVTSIGSYAFQNCTLLESITIGDSITSIGNQAFWNCYNLVEVYNLSNLNITVGSDSNGYVGYYAKVIHTSLDEPSILETVEDYIFMTWEDKYYLMGYIGSNTELILPESYNGNNYEIYQYAFNSRDDITKVTIPDSVTTMGNYAFAGCTSLTEINFNATAMNDLSSSNYVFYNAGKNGDGIKVTIGKNVTKIPAYLFYPVNNTSYLPKITSVVFEEESVCESIGSYAFYNCTSLASVNYIGSIEGWCNISFSNYGSNPLYYANNLYLNGELVTNLVIPDTVTKINNCAFCGCTSLRSITIPDSVKTIGDSAFYGCTSLTSITIGNSVTSIGEYAFYNCKGLTSITIPDSVTSIGYGAFYGCTSLTIYCEAESKPSGWSSYWNYSNRPVVWGHTHSFANGECVCGMKQN